MKSNSVPIVVKLCDDQDLTRTEWKDFQRLKHIMETKNDSVVIKACLRLGYLVIPMLKNAGLYTKLIRKKGYEFREKVL